VQVYSAKYPVVKLGEEFQGDGKPALKLCYMQHALASGEHYNSLAAISGSGNA
jgi:hypothetical protein